MQPQTASVKGKELLEDTLDLSKVQVQSASRALGALAHELLGI